MKKAEISLAGPLFFGLTPKATIFELKSGKSVTADELSRRVVARAEELKSKFQFEHGSTVVLLNFNSIQFYIDLFACFYLGLNPVPLDPGLSEKEKAVVYEHCRATLIISANTIERTNISLQDRLPFSSTLILYTSGTTGKPKGVVIPSQALKLKMEMLSKYIPASEVRNSFCGLPTYFGHGLIGNSLFPIFNSEKLLVAEKFDLQLGSDFSKIINDHQINFFSTVPSVWELILNFAKDVKMPSLKRIHCGSAPLEQDRITRIFKWAGDVDLYDMYGITEMLNWFGARKIKPQDTSVREFADYWDAQVKTSENGELLVKAPYMFTEYLFNPEENAKAFDGEGYFKTGDIFESAQMKGRLKNVVMKNGSKIYCEDIDQLLIKSNLVMDVCSFPIPDAFSGERLGVLMVLKSGATEKMVDDFCKDQLGAFKVPDQYWVREQIVRTSRGKINRLNLFSELTSGAR